MAIHLGADKDVINSIDFGQAYKEASSNGKIDSLTTLISELVTKLNKEEKEKKYYKDLASKYLGQSKASDLAAQNLRDQINNTPNKTSVPETIFSTKEVVVDKVEKVYKIISSSFTGDGKATMKYGIVKKDIEKATLRFKIISNDSIINPERPDNYEEFLEVKIVINVVSKTGNSNTPLEPIFKRILVGTTSFVSISEKELEPVGGKFIPGTYYAEISIKDTKEKIGEITPLVIKVNKK